MTTMPASASRGARGAKYQVARGIAEFVRENGAALLRAEGGPCALEGAPNSLFGGVRLASDGTRFVFLLNNDPAASCRRQGDRCSQHVCPAG